MFVIARERMWLIGLRQAWYLSRANASRLSSRTVLYLDPPSTPSASPDSDVQSTFGEDSRTQWLVKKTKTLDDLVESRDAKAMKLEFAEVAYLRQASKMIAQTTGTNDDVDIESARPREQSSYIPGTSSADLINHLRNDVKEATEKVKEKRASFTNDATDGHGRCAVFVEYANQSAAQRAYRGETKLHIPVPPNIAVQSRLIGVVPNEVVWRNLMMPQAERLSKKSIANLLIASLIIFWSIPTAIVGSISNVNYLASYEWLHWLKNLPSPVLGLLTGFLPPLLTSLLASYVPNIMRCEYCTLIQNVARLRNPFS